MSENLLGIPSTYLPPDPSAAALEDGVDPRQVAVGHPTSSLAWAVLAEGALADDLDVEAYAFARTGYHRGLDALRKSGWRGQGPVPWAHEPNQGFLRALAALAKAADRIGEDDEHRRCADFLRDSSADAARALDL
ncbi:MAG: DUF3151 domain-containing protein [Ornithinimicrobium sp.]